jgi:hypothetical protein
VLSSASPTRAQNADPQWQRDRSRAFRRFLSVAFWFLLALVLEAILINFRVTIYDEGLTLYGSLRVFHGQVPYRDFWTMYPPGQFYLFAALFHLGVWGIWDRILFILFNAVSGVVILRLLEQLTARPWLGRCTGALILFWLSDRPSYAFPIYPAITFILLATLCMHYRWRGGRSYLVALAGMALGFAALFRHDLALYALIALCAACVVDHAHNSDRSRRPWQDPLRLIAFAGLIVAPALLLLLLCVPLHDLYYGLIYIPGFIYPKVRSLPFPNVHEVVHGFRRPWIIDLPALGATVGSSEYNIVWLPVIVVLTAIPWLIAMLRRRRAELPNAASYTALVLLTALLFLKGMVRVSPLHMTQAVVPALMLLAVLAADFRTLWIGSRIGFIVAASWALLCMIGTARTNYDMLRENLRLLNPSNSYGSFAQMRHPPAGLERARCLLLEKDETNAILYVQSRTAPSEKIFVGVPRYDVLSDNDISFYFFSGRDAATGWYDLHPGVETTEPIQRQMIADLQKSHVRYIVEDDWGPPNEPNAARISSNVTLLSDYIRQNYTPDREFNHIQIFRRAAPFDF